MIKSAEWYRDKLGFCYETFAGDPPVFYFTQRDDFRLISNQVKNKSDIRAELENCQ